MVHQKLNSLQLLRAIAVSLVIFVHSAYFGVPVISAFNPVGSFYHLKSWGTIGVDLFFAISGFIMTIVTPAYNFPGGWKSFFRKRIIRIIPLYYLLSIIDILIIVFVHHQKLDFEVVMKTLLFFPIFDSGKFSSPLISVGWSLSYEMYFYALIGLFLTFKKNSYKKLLLLILTFSLIGLLLNPANVLLRFLTSPILLEFGLGIVCGLLYEKFTKQNYLLSSQKRIAILLASIGMALVCITIFTGTYYEISDRTIIENNSPLAFYRVIIWGIPCAMFLMGVALSEYAFSKSIPWLLVLAGDASYSCYLIHTQVFPVLAHLFKHFSLGAIPFLIITIPFCLLVSIIFHKLIEKPLISGINRLAFYKKPVLTN